MKLEARGKINWTLDVLGQLPNGYHQLDMLMQPVTLCDRIMLEPSHSLSLRVSGGAPAGADNLAWRAAELLREQAGGSPGAAILLEKHIPMGAGMGGGSADAAAVLLGLNRLWSLGLDQESLERLGLRLGADVPFQLRGGLCRTGGIGEQLQQAPDAPRYALCMIQPCEGLSTGEVYRRWHTQARLLHVQTDQALNAILTADWAGLRRLLANALEPVSREMRPQIGEAIDALCAQGAEAALMTGSGSAVFGVFRSLQEAGAAGSALKTRWETVFVCETCRHSVCFVQD